MAANPSDSYGVYGICRYKLLNESERHRRYPVARPPPTIGIYPVSHRVNAPKDDDPGLIEPMGPGSRISSQEN
jgi:hypothetical protein